MEGSRKIQRQYVALNINGSFHTVLLIGYTKDCGFFMSNVRHDGGKHVIWEHWMPLKEWYKVGKHWSKRKKAPYITSNIPKLIHHIDGKAQVSGDGIISGFYKFFKKGKGVNTKSYDLTNVNNDGGPTMGSTVWGLDHFLYKNVKNSIVFDRSLIFDDFVEKEIGYPVCYVFEAYYVPKKIEEYRRYITNSPVKFHYKDGIIIGYNAPKKAKIEDYIAGDVIPLLHPVYGEIKGKIIPSPDNSPGFLILTCKTSTIGEGFCEHPYGHQISGAPSFLSLKGCKNIFIQYPHTVFPKEFISKAKSLDFRNIDRVKSKIDDFLYNFFLRKRM